MARKCRDTVFQSAVDVTCRTTKCAFPSTDTASHVTEIVNGRPGSLYQVEVCTVAMNGGVDFGHPAIQKAITLRGIVSTTSAAKPASIAVSMNHLGAPLTEEIQTTIEFYDATRRTGPNTFSGSKESRHVDYEFDLI